MSTREVRAALAISQPRVSQLVRDKVIAAELDSDGRLKYDRESVERYSQKRAAQLAQDDPEERAAKHAEAQHRLRKMKKQSDEEKAARQARDDDWKERAVKALETIAERLETKQ